MEPKSDSELRSLLREWRAPALPPSLEERVLGRRESWWRFLLRGYIRVPVPVACCLAIFIIAAGWRMVKPPVGPCSATGPAPVVARTRQIRAVPVHSPSTSCSVDSSC